MRNQLTKGYIATIIAVSFLLSPLGAAAVGVTWDYSSTVLKPLAAVIGSRTSVGTTTATTNATLTVSATSTATTVVLSLLKSTGASIFSALASGNVGIGTTSPYSLLSVGGDLVVGASSAGGTLGDLYLPKLGTAAGTIIAVDSTGKVIATTTSAGGVTSVTGGWPIISSGGTTPNLTWGGLATSSPLVAASGLLYATGVNTMASISTSTPLNMSISGNSGTATALASDPTDCGANTWANAIAASGNLTCSAITYAGITAMSSANLFGIINDETGGSGVLVGSASPTFTGLAVIASASTTNITASSELVMPSGTTKGSTVAGQAELDTTDDQLKIGDGTNTAVYSPILHISTNVASSTWGTGTTTLPFAAFTDPATLNGTMCWTDAGTLNVQITYGPSNTLMTNIVASSTGYTISYTSNNTPGANATSTVSVGSAASSPTKLECTTKGKWTAT